MNLVEKIKERETDFDSKELFDISDTKEIINNNYNALVNEIQLLKQELKNLYPVDTGKSFNLTKTISKYEKYQEELSELCKVFNNSKINYAEKLNMLLLFRINYQIRENSVKIISTLKEIKKNTKNIGDKNGY